MSKETLVLYISYILETCRRPALAGREGRERPALASAANEAGFWTFRITRGPVMLVIAIIKEISCGQISKIDVAT
jgi:hypothetical protein